MSMSFDGPVNEETKKLIRELFGDPSASDEKTFLFDKMEVIKQHEMKEIANMAKQPATIGIHAHGEIITMSDGTKYQATDKGWKKIEE